MIKRLRSKKLEEIIGKPGPFNPVHHKATHGEDPESSNQYAHKIAEVVTPDTGGRAQGPATKGNLAYRKKAADARSNQKQKNRYLNNQSSHTSKMYEDNGEEELGTTDTGKKGKEAETVTVNPKDNSALSKGELNKNTTVKETKEK